MSILVSLTPAESKALIGRAVAVHPLVKKAMAQGRIILCGGSTTAYAAGQLTGKPTDPSHFACGVVTDGLLCQTPDDRIRTLYFVNGTLMENDTSQSDYQELSGFLAQMGKGDLYIKGANAIDPQGNAGFLLAHDTGGNIMMTLPKICAQGVKFLIPTGLEKLIPSVPEAQRSMEGIYEYDYTFGRGCGYVSVPNGIILHEIAALELLTGAHAVQSAAGGIGGSEGAVTLVIHCDSDAQQEATIALLKEIKGEPPTPVWKKACGDCAFRCRYRFG